MIFEAESAYNESLIFAPGDRLVQMVCCKRVEGGLVVSDILHIYIYTSNALYSIFLPGKGEMIPF